MLTQYQRSGRIALIVGLILLIPLILTIRDGNVQGVGWNWSPGDFVAMGTLLFIAGSAIDFAVRRVTNPTYRVLAVLLILVALIAIWTELAVGAVSQLIAFLLR